MLESRSEWGFRPSHPWVVLRLNRCNQRSECDHCINYQFDFVLCGQPFFLGFLRHIIFLLSLFLDSLYHHLKCVSTLKVCFFLF
nr:MAG TPA: hypothetical protein [Caudoviricetes sp.]